MSSVIADVPASPLLKLNLPSPEEFRKRKVALISGTRSS
jgi:GDPmannose 4,6-dehydratase